MDLSSLSNFVKACLVLIPLGGLLDLIGFASPYWLSISSTNYSGLWKACNSLICLNILDLPNIKGSLRAVQFFETVGFILVCCAVVLLILTLFVEYFRGKKIFEILNAIICFASAGCILVGVIIYGTQDGVSDFLSWAFALCIVGGILVGVAGVLLIVSAVGVRN